MSLIDRLFDLYGMFARARCRVAAEQIDGISHIYIGTYIVEAGSHNAPTSASDVFAFQGKLKQGPNWVRGPFVCHSGFSDDWLAAIGRGGKVICLERLDLHDTLRDRISVDHVIEQKVLRSIERGFR